MARFDASGEKATRSASGLESTDWTMAAWVRLDTMPCDISSLYVVEDSYDFGPVAATAPENIDVWENAFLCTLDGEGQPIPGTPIDKPT